MKDILKFLLITVISLIIGLIPELGMYFAWNMVDPEGFWQKFAMVFVFSFGLGFCVLFGWLGLMLWVALLEAFR